jgi:hypothetical protein
LCLILVATWTIEAAATSTIVVPVDLEKQAMEMNVLCASAAPNLQPSYLERFEAWKQRLGSYYQRYQKLLYDAPVMHLPEPERASKLTELIALVEEQTAQRMQELRKNPREARELCILMSNGISDPENDEELKRFVNEVAGK